MKKILRCPECGSGKHSITVLETGTRYYTAELNEDDDGIMTGAALDFEADEGGESYQCEECAYDSYKSADFIAEVPEE